MLGKGLKDTYATAMQGVADVVHAAVGEKAGGFCGVSSWTYCCHQCYYQA